MALVARVIDNIIRIVSRMLKLFVTAGMCFFLIAIVHIDYSYAFLEFLHHLRGPCSINYKYGSIHYTECRIDTNNKTGTITTLDGQQHSLVLGSSNGMYYFDGELNNSDKPRCVRNSVMEICMYDK